MSYATDTTVSVEKSKAEIERLVARYGTAQFMSAWDNRGRAIIGWTMDGRQVRIAVPLPNQEDPEFVHPLRNGEIQKHRRWPKERQHAMWEKACRSRWRALALIVRAKLEAVEAGISTFEAEFLSNIVLPDGSTVGQTMQPQLAAAYETGKMPPLLPWRPK